MAHAYAQRRRRMLIDTQVPGWDPEFLARLDPEALADCAVVAGLDAVMLPCKTHLGLVNGRTTVARAHPGLRGRDVIGELIALLHERDILVCGNSSIAFDTHAFDEHPDWRLVPARSVEGVPVVSYWPRHSVLCLNNAGYRAYELRLLDELLGQYDFDAFLLDMAFWPAICVCGTCRDRFRREEGLELPEVIDWSTMSWTRFQSARERWTDELAGELSTAVRACKDIPVYQNFAISTFGWTAGKSLKSFDRDTFIGLDLYGGPDQQLFGCKLMLATTHTQPPEYMTTCSPSLRDHATIKPESEFLAEALASTSLGCAMLFIDNLDPDGTPNRDMYGMLGRVFAATEPFADVISGTHVEDVAVYFSSDACVNLDHNGTHLSQLALEPRDWSPHLRAAIGAVRALQQHHVATGVVTWRQLGDLARWPVMVVPDLTRITPDEEDALRAYVAGGGRLYASGRTSLLRVDPDGTDDFVLGDVLGVRWTHDVPRQEVFVQPLDPELRAATSPQRTISSPGVAGASAVPVIQTTGDAQTLASLSLPYGFPHAGTRMDQHWASAYARPPWTDTGTPAITLNTFGKGIALYSSVALETIGSPASTDVFVACIRRLLGTGISLSATTHPSVWVEGFHDADRQRFAVSVLHYPTDLPALPVDATVSVQLPTGREVCKAWQCPDGANVEVRPSALPGSIEFDCRADPLAVVIIEYGRSGGEG